MTRKEGKEKEGSGAPYKDAAWVQTINRLLRSEARPDPRPKPNQPAKLKYWNQTDLAIAANIRGNTLSDIMAGKRKPSLDSLETVADALGQPPFLFLMDPQEAERYASFRVAKQTEDTAHGLRISAQQAAHDIMSELAPDIASLIERRLLTGQPLSQPAKPLAGKPALAHTSAQAKARKVGR
jgi:transcriptional regulator with XRE-family HTH domain